MFFSLPHFFGFQIHDFSIDFSIEQKNIFEDPADSKKTPRFFLIKISPSVKNFCIGEES